ncbi:MAG: NYN domain-containing protein [Ignavibacteriaceae bacterium]
MKSYIIDGNNLMGKINTIKMIQSKDKQLARERLVMMIEKFFNNRKEKVYLHFDGFQNTPLSLSKGKIIYSEKSIADKKIKDQIEIAKNRKNLIVVSSDHEIQNFARVCSCNVLSSEEFSKGLTSNKDVNEEENRIKAINDIEEFKKLFGADL